ncbi:amidohydrolase family protein [Luteitalea sp. TBR-22]|uniref:amidohydrolase family protein n=1 Tax=Luteitalea sp. TBR-22 TaxID=2802971 RepID=UPI001EF5A5D5|nr:amidohydrolase family protein [Luteitalea sp. TBR-22]
MARGWLSRRTWPLAALVTMVGAAVMAPSAQVRPAGRDTAVHARKPARLLIRHAMVIYGNGKPPYGPMDILVQDGTIANVAPSLPVEADAVIDATGKYVMPGLVDTHMHWHDERAGIPMPIQYERNLYLANGVTLTRENGGNFTKSKQWQAESAADQIVAPRMQVYWVVSRGNGTAEAIRANVREAKARGADGLKIFGMDRDQLEATMAEARAQGLKTTTHIAVEEVTAKDFAELGVDSIEHFYGIADAALDGVQHFPADMNYSNELMRFSRAGELYAQADPKKLDEVLDLMVAKKVAWSPTLSIYEASRDVIKAQNLPWYKEYLHPALQAFFEPNLANHGSYFVGWTNTMEVRWKQQYRIWMDALKSFGNKGGVITTGDDAGFIHSLYGFGLVRELELHEEAGFHPLDVIKHGTVNGATLLGMGDKLGRVRQGFLADLLVVNGNPLENLRVLNPYGVEVMKDGRMTRGGGIEWTIKNGIPYHVPTLMKEVKAMVEADRKKPEARPTAP